MAAADAAVVGEVGAAAVGVPAWVVAAATQASPVQAVATVALVANLVPVDSAKAKAAIQGGAVALEGFSGAVAEAVASEAEEDLGEQIAQLAHQRLWPKSSVPSLHRLLQYTTPLGVDPLCLSHCSDLHWH